MECSCTIDVNIGESPRLEITHHYPIATGNKKCCECNKIIRPGERYLFETGQAEGWEDLPEDEQEQEVYAYSTCLDCESIREQFFHDFIYTGILHDLYLFLDESGGSTHEECIANLTPRARKIVCGYIEDIWQKIEKEEE